jgi:hypothetical protein
MGATDMTRPVNLAELRAAQKAAEDEDARAATAKVAAERDARRLARLIDPPDDDTPSVDAVARLEAKDALPAARVALGQATLAAHRAAARATDARDAVKAAEAGAAVAEAAAIHRELLPILKNDVQPLVDRLAALKARHPNLDVHVWPELQSSSHGGFFTFESTLDSVIKSARANGWTDK